MVTRLIYLLLIISIPLLGCSSSGDDSDSDINADGGEHKTMTLPAFNKTYVFLESDSKVKDRNFYWTTLVENNTNIKVSIKNNEKLSAYLETAKQRINTISNQNNATALEYAKALKFSTNEQVAISTAVKKAVENNSTLFLSLGNTHIGPSGAFNRFHEVTNIARLNQLIVEEMLLGINQIIDTYIAGIDPKYPDLDRISYDVNSNQYKALLRNLVNELISKKQQYELFYQPFLSAALGALEINNRDEAARFVPLRLGENAQAYQKIKTTKWEDYQYSVLVVLGDAPNSSGDLPNISLGGMERCDYAMTLFNKDIAPFIAFTGANVAPFQSSFHEAIEMKKYVMNTYKIPENRILVDPHARHTTTNMRNIGRLIFKYGIPANKQALLSTSQSQSTYVSSNKFANRCVTQMKHLPMELHNRLSDRDIEFIPKIEVLHLDSSDPLDP